MATCNPNTLLAGAGAIAALNQKMAFNVIAALLCRILQTLNPMATCNVGELVAEAQCFACLPQNQLLMLIAQLLCNIDTTIAGASNVMCDTVDPTTGPPYGNCAVYYRPDNGAVWIWRSATADWLQIIAP
jgi:hypothetical protein